MNAQFIQSWRGALLVAAIVTAGVTGYKVVFGPSSDTRIAQFRASRVLPAGQPSQEMFSRQVVAAQPFVSARMTLGQLTRYLQRLKYEIAWEPVDIDVFILRAGGIDALTNRPFEFAIQFIALSGPAKDGRVIGIFNGPAVGIESMAYNRETVSDQEIADWLVSIFPEVANSTIR